LRLLSSTEDRDARDVKVVADGVGEGLGRGAYDMRYVAARVDDRIPGPAVELGKIIFAITVDLLHVGEELGVRLPAVEKRDFVAAHERFLGRRAPEELGSTENEEPHA
jgi:hypothetical protein